jgi:nitrogen fixation NifU-like protein
MKELYSHHLCDHYRNPRHWGTLNAPDVSATVLNPSCGDRIHITACMVDDHLKEVAFTGVGCILSQAATSLLTEAVLSLSRDEILAMNVEEMQKLVGIPVGALRQKCIMLGLEALQQALHEVKTT